MKLKAFHLAYLYLIVAACVVSNSAQTSDANMSLHEYCLSTRLHHQYQNVHEYALTFVNVCDFPEEYAKCASGGVKHPFVYESPAENIYFPEEVDVYRAVLLMCPLYFKTVVNKFPAKRNFSEECNGAVTVNYKSCNITKEWHSSFRDIELSIQETRAYAVRYASCKILTWFYTCLKDLVKQECGDGFDPIYDFHLAKLGGYCLAKRSVVVPLISFKDCSKHAHTAVVSELVVLSFLWTSAILPLLATHTPAQIRVAWDKIRVTVARNI